MTADVAVVGAGWAGAVAARALHDAGLQVHVFEQAKVLGGHSRSEMLHGVVYEPEGPHIFHTSNQVVAEFVQRHGMRRPFEHRVFTEVFLDGDDGEPSLIAWPPQIGELQTLRIWPQVERELGERPATPSKTNLESYCVSIMGRTLYEVLIKGYSIKQWGCDPAELSSRFAVARLDLRADGYTRLFRDTWEFFHPKGSQVIIERVMRRIPVTVGSAISIADLAVLERQFKAIIVTAPLDEFANRPGELDWRGIRTVSHYTPLDDPHATRTPAYQINRPSLRRPYTRTVETKHATGQVIAGTVVSEEYPDPGAKHYPVAKVYAMNERRNAALQKEIQECTTIPLFFCGRLANYTYINQDAAIAQGMGCAREVRRILVES